MAKYPTESHYRRIRTIRKLRRSGTITTKLAQTLVFEEENRHVRRTHAESIIHNPA